MQKKDFFLCGFTGWCLEIFWTGLHSLFTGNFTMMGKTSLLMFPVYGLTVNLKVFRLWYGEFFTAAGFFSWNF